MSYNIFLCIDFPHKTCWRSSSSHRMLWESYQISLSQVNPLLVFLPESASGLEEATERVQIIRQSSFVRNDKKRWLRCALFPLIVNLNSPVYSGCQLTIFSQG